MQMRRWRLAMLSAANLKKANKRRRRVGVIVDTAAGIGRAFAENNFYTALGISALIAANGAAQLSAINSAGGGGGSISGARWW